MNATAATDGTSSGATLFDTAIGPCGIAWGPGGIASVQLPDTDPDALLARMRRNVQRATGVDGPLALLREGPVADLPPPVQDAIRGVVGMLQGDPDPLLHIVLDMQGLPAFHRAVYACARRIVPGKTATYGDIAKELGEPGASRAVGQALGHNPFAPIVPCHRVLAAGARSGGFSADGGVQTKLRMLLIERASFGAPGLFD